MVGNCGSSAAPMNEDVRSYREKYLSASLGDDFEFNWVTMDDYMNLVGTYGVSFNVVPLVGQGTIRQNVMGYEDREPTKSELEKMKDLLTQSMEDGAWGLSTGFIHQEYTQKPMKSLSWQRSWQIMKVYILATFVEKEKLCCPP